MSALFLLIYASVYFLPSMIAALKRRHNFAKIFILNLLLGWSGIGWLVAFFWASRNRVPIA